MSAAFPRKDVKITYARWDSAGRAFESAIQSVIQVRSLKRICEVGGGANPALSLEFVGAHHLNYTILDISREELDKAPPGYAKIVADLCDDSVLERAGGFQLVFSKWLAEHVVNPEAFHRNVWGLLVNGGIALHFFPTMYAFPFVMNRLMPETLSSRILNLVVSRDPKMQRKFPAFYRWCRGPTRRQIALFEGLGFRVLEYLGFFGHGYYNRIPVLRHALDRITDILIQHPSPHITSYACVTLQKVA